MFLSFKTLFCAVWKKKKKKESLNVAAAYYFRISKDLKPNCFGWFWNL